MGAYVYFYGQIGRNETYNSTVPIIDHPYADVVCDMSYAHSRRRVPTLNENYAPEMYNTMHSALNYYSYRQLSNFNDNNRTQTNTQSTQMSSLESETNTESNTHTIDENETNTNLTQSNDLINNVINDNMNNNSGASAADNDNESNLERPHFNSMTSFCLRRR